MIPEPVKLPYPAPDPRYDFYCDLCGGRCDPDDWSDAAGMVICPRCIEETLEGQVNAN